VLALQDAGASAIAVHGRVKEHIKERITPADWIVLRRIRAHPGVRVPIFANGGIASAADVDACLAFTGCEGVMSSEALLENPGLFSDGRRTHLGAQRLLLPPSQHLSLPPCRSDSLDYAWEYLDMAELFDEAPASVRGHLIKLLFAPLRIHTHLRDTVVRSDSVAELRVVVQQLCVAYGHRLAGAGVTGALGPAVSLAPAAAEEFGPRVFAAPFDAAPGSLLQLVRSCLHLSPLLPLAAVTAPDGTGAGATVALQPACCRCGSCAEALPQRIPMNAAEDIAASDTDAGSVLLLCTSGSGGAWATAQGRVFMRPRVQPAGRGGHHSRQSTYAPSTAATAAAAFTTVATPGPGEEGAVSAESASTSDCAIPLGGQAALATGDGPAAAGDSAVAAALGGLPHPRLSEASAGPPDLRLQLVAATCMELRQQPAAKRRRVSPSPSAQAGELGQAEKDAGEEDAEQAPTAEPVTLATGAAALPECEAPLLPPLTKEQRKAARAAAAAAQASTLAGVLQARELWASCRGARASDADVAEFEALQRSSASTGAAAGVCPPGFLVDPLQPGLWYMRYQPGVYAGRSKRAEGHEAFLAQRQRPADAVTVVAADAVSGSSSSSSTGLEGP